MAEWQTRRIGLPPDYLADVSVPLLGAGLRAPLQGGQVRALVAAGPCCAYPQRVIIAREDGSVGKRSGPAALGDKI